MPAFVCRLSTLLKYNFIDYGSQLKVIMTSYLSSPDEQQMIKDKQNKYRQLKKLDEQNEQNFLTNKNFRLPGLGQTIIQFHK